MHTPIRIAVLECGKPAKQSDLKYGGYHGIFTNILQHCAEVLGQPDKLDPQTGFELSRWDVVKEQTYPALEDIDAVLLTGSSKYIFVRIGACVYITN